MILSIDELIKYCLEQGKIKLSQFNKLSLLKTEYHKNQLIKQYIIENEKESLKMSGKKYKITCKNCNSELTELNYCPICGYINPSDHTQE